jgi:catechol 2,3-dioxygenase-like lactoylglutathione lyase family enzyme
MPYHQGRLLDHVHLRVTDAEVSKRFYRAALEAALKAGGQDNGAPGPRAYHTGYYAAFVLDPDRNNIEAACHGPTTRPASSISVERT